MPGILFTLCFTTQICTAVLLVYLMLCFYVLGLSFFYFCIVLSDFIIYWHSAFCYRPFTWFNFFVVYVSSQKHGHGSLCFNRKLSVVAPDCNADFGILRETLMPSPRSDDVKSSFCNLLIWEYMPNSRWERLLARAI